MKLKTVSVSKYRSIDKQSVFNIGDYTVLVGPNNQGKSNLMRATVLALEVIERWSQLPREYSAGAEVPTGLLVRRRVHRTRRGYLGSTSRSASGAVTYDWATDYPIFAQSRKGTSKKTSIRLDFELSVAEQAEFREETGLGINEKLPIVVELGERKSSIGIPKQRGSGHKEKASLVTAFLTRRIGLLYIPAVRPASIAMEVAEEILAARRELLARDKEYSHYLTKIEEIEREVSDEVSLILRDTLQRFMPQVKSVDLETRSLARSAGLDDIRIDDGVGTSLTAKGDGIQSLVALALTLEWTNSNSSFDRQLIVAIEEPESHLHPAGVHELRDALNRMAERQQVIVTTHSQSLINSARLERNVIVSDGGARAAKSIGDLRDTLGVRVSDALVGAEVMVITEGIHDSRLFSALLGARERKIADLVSGRRVVFENSGSATKVSTLVIAANAIMSTPVVILDGDEAGIKEAGRLIADGLVSHSNLVQLGRQNAKGSELEDMLDVDSYRDVLEGQLGLQLTEREARLLGHGCDLPWSGRLEKLLRQHGFPDVKNLVIQLKGVINAHVVREVEAGNSVGTAELDPILDRLAAIVLKASSDSAR